MQQNMTKYLTIYIEKDNNSILWEGEIMESREQFPTSQLLGFKFGS